MTIKGQEPDKRPGKGEGPGGVQCEGTVGVVVGAEEDKIHDSIKEPR